jgi:outer membrane lipoprotein-sorting protein
MRLRIRYIILFCTFLAFSLLLISFRYKQSKTITNNRELIDKIFNAVDNVKTMRYKLQCNERIKGRMQYFESKVKLQVSPRKLYLSLKGPEVLWIQGTNNGDALVNPSSFPYMNLNLDPYGSLMRKDQHHTIHEMGFQYLADILKDGMKKAGDKLDKYFTLVGEDNFYGRPCYKLSITFPEFAWNSYTVKKGENLITIARKLKVSEYMVLMNNPKISWYNDVKEGQIIKVPNAYGKQTLLLIDKETYLPVSNTVFDDQGLYEKYEYIDLQVNCVILPEEFTKNYKGYNF